MPKHTKHAEVSETNWHAGLLMVSRDQPFQIVQSIWQESNLDLDTL